jgi:hypothetical protein
MSGRMSVPALCLRALRGARARRGEGALPLVQKDLATAAGKRTHRDKGVECEEKDATPDLFLKHPDATLTTYVR